MKCGVKNQRIPNESSHDPKRRRFNPNTNRSHHQNKMNARKEESATLRELLLRKALNPSGLFHQIASEIEGIEFINTMLRNKTEKLNRLIEEREEKNHAQEEEKAEEENAELNRVKWEDDLQDAPLATHRRANKVNTTTCKDHSIHIDRIGANK
eukprot:183685_1